MKGIILAGGKGTRLYPATIPIVKQLLPVYDKPMIYYPLSVFLQIGIKDILIISNPNDLQHFKKLFKNGDDLGIKIQYKIQEKPNGLAESLIIGEDFIGDENFALILGDNLFFGDSLVKKINEIKIQDEALIFGYKVSNPKLYGNIEFDENNLVTGITEKPKNPKSKFAVTGLYFYNKDAIKFAKSLKPSKRGELEITDINNLYLKEGKLKTILLDRGFTWFDTGNCDCLSEAAEFVKIIEKRQGIKIGCIEEIAYKNNFINKEQLLNLANKYEKSNYGKYLLSLV